MLTYAKPEHLSLRTHPFFNEKWLQDRIAEDPSILGLGDLEVLSVERQQDHAGRLDMLLIDAERERRYELEIQLGATDESHIIRCLEYWDIERKRYPQYDHCAVLVAEDITSRFLNVIALFNGHIPMIAINLTALKVEENIVLDFVRVMDRFALRDDDEASVASAPANRDYWEQKAAARTLAVADSCLALVNAAAGNERFAPVYNRHYIGLRDGHRSTAFIHFKPKKQFTQVLSRVENSDEWIRRAEDAGLEAGFKFSQYVQITLRPDSFESNKGLLTELFRVAISEYDG